MVLLTDPPSLLPHHDADDCHALISPFHYSPLLSLLIPLFQSSSQLWNCFYSVVGSVSQAILVLLPFHSPFGQHLMGIFLKYLASSCNSLAHLSLVIDTLVPLCSLLQSSPLLSLVTSLGPLECPPRPPVYMAFSW